MNMKTKWPEGLPPFAPSRRQFLLRSAVALTFGATGAVLLGSAHQGVIGDALAQATDGAKGIDAASGYAGFLQLSQYLTGKSALDDAIGQAIFAVLSTDAIPHGASDNGFTAQVAALNTFILQSKTPALALQATLNKEQPSLAALPKKLMQAWYRGIVGTGSNARAVAYEQALMYPPIADVIVMPTYARGIPGYWAAPHVFAHAAPLPKA